MPTQMTAFNGASMPSRDDPDNFAVEADDLLSRLPAFQAQVNTITNEVNANAVAAEASKNNAQTIADDAADVLAVATLLMNTATAHVDAETTENKWVSGANYQDGTVVWSPTDRLSYRRIGTGAGTTDPALDSVNWKLKAAPKLARRTRTANAMLGPGDNGCIIDITAGTFTQTFDAAATLGNGWQVILRNLGTGNITVTMDGRTFIMYTGEARLVLCDGAGLFSLVLTAFSKVFTLSETWTKPPGYTAFGGIEWGGGASGDAAVSHSGTANFGNGGSGGSCEEFLFLSAELPNTINVQVGSGGEGVTAVYSYGSVDGLPGSDSQFHTVVAKGGLRGGSRPQAAIADYQGGGGGTGSSGGTGQNGGNSGYGGGGGGGASYNGGTRTLGGTSGRGGAGGRGNLGSSVIAASDGAIPGGGGGGTVTPSSADTVTSGAGARGEVRVWGIK